MQGNVSSIRWTSRDREMAGHQRRRFDLNGALVTTTFNGHLEVVQWLATNGASDVDGALMSAASRSGFTWTF